MKPTHHRVEPLHWWSEAGPDVCEFCLHTFRMEVGFYCADCDSPICPACVISSRERHVSVCPGCASGGSS